MFRNLFSLESDGSDGKCCNRDMKKKKVDRESDRLKENDRARRTDTSTAEEQKVTTELVQRMTMTL